MRDDLETLDRVFLEKLGLAVKIILDVGKDPGGLPASLESELFVFKDRVDRAILLSPAYEG